MTTIETSIMIKRPVEDVFTVLSNLENNPRWSSAFVEAKKTSAGPTGVGTTWRFVGKFLGQRVESEQECTEYEPNRKSAQKSKGGPFPAEVRQTYEPVEGGTRVSILGKIDAGGFFKLAEPLFAKVIKRSAEADFANLKDMMEAHAL